MAGTKPGLQARFELYFSGNPRFLRSGPHRGIATLNFRFSIKSLLALIALSAVVLWWLVTPSVVSARFAEAVGQMEFDRAGEMFIVPEHGMMLKDWREFIVSATATPADLSLQDLVAGRRRLHLKVSYQSPGKEIAGHFPLEANMQGIHRPNTADAAASKE